MASCKRSLRINDFFKKQTFTSPSSQDCVLLLSTYGKQLGSFHQSWGWEINGWRKSPLKAPKHYQARWGLQAARGPASWDKG